jgi:hypothetical protein
VDKSFKVPGEEGWGLGNAVTGADVPPPLVPFAGCDRKAMPPSPAKPFSIPASPAKPSPFKERVDAATEAVVQKNWNQRQVGSTNSSRAHMLRTVRLPTSCKLQLLLLAFHQHHASLCYLWYYVFLPIMRQRC